MRKGFVSLLLLLLAYNSYSQSISPKGPVNICTGQNQLLTVIDSESGEKFQWQKDGINITGATNATYNVNASGDYSVVLSGGKKIAAVKVIINSYPVTGFTSSATPGICSNEEIVFTNTTTGAGSYLWDFGDPESLTENTSTQKDPKHTFIGNPGNGTQNFTVTMTAESAAGGCVKTSTSTITTKQIPDGALGGNAAGTFQGKTYFKICGQFTQGDFTFSNTSTTRATNTDYRIIWGDSSPDFVGTDFNLLNHTYPIGTHKLTLLVTGKNGCVTTTEYYVFVGTNPSVGLANPGNTAVCSGEALTFPITETANNVPGTVYTVTFSDNSTPKVYIHPAVPTFEKHQFDITSCGTISSDGTKQYQNSFSASIEAANPCASSSASIVPIYVSEKPKADFAISPLDTICVNTTVTLKNTSKSNTVDNGVCKNGNIIWKITPATGWTLTSGNFGNDFSSNMPSIWQSGSEFLGVKFTQPGVYSVTVKTGSDFCGINEKTSTICVNPLPTGSFTLDKKEGCGPVTVSATTATSALTCGTMSYLWTVKYANLPNCAGSATGDFKFISGTNSSSQNPVIQFNEPGIYTLDVTLINPAKACSTKLAAQTVTIKSKPIIAVSGIPASLCQNDFISPMVTTTCSNESPPVYAWTFTGATPASSAQAVPGKIIYNTPGTHPITLTVTNECGVTTYTGTITVNPTPELTIPPDITACAGENIGPLNITVLPAASVISWINNNPGIGLPASGSSGTIPSFSSKNITNSPISSLLTFTTKLGSCTDAGSLKIVVNPRPDAPVVNDLTYCENALAAPLSAQVTTGNILIWYDAATGGTGENLAPVPETDVPGIRNYYVSQKNTTTQCESNRVRIQVTVQKTPVITSTDYSNPLTCASSTGTITLNGLMANTSYQVRYTKNASAAIQISLLADATGKLVITGLSAGQYANVFVSLNNCPSGKAGTFELKDPAAPAAPVATVTSPVCSGSAVTFSVSSPEAGSLSYTWTGPNGFQKSEQNPTITAATILAKGNYKVTVTRNSCTSEAATVNLIVNETPGIPGVSSNTPVCTGNTVQLNSSSTFSGVITYEWTGPNGFTSAEKNPVIPGVSKAAEGTYNLKLISAVGNCISVDGSTSVIINPTPKIGSAFGTGPSECATATGIITLEELLPNTIYSVSYSKDGGTPVTPLLSSNSSGQLIIPNLLAGTYQNINVSLKGCPSESVGPFTLSDPNPPASPSIKSNSEVCVGEDILLEAITTLPGTINYTWTGPNGYISYDKNPKLSKATVANSGIYQLTITQNKCVSLPVVSTVIVNTLPAGPLTNPVSYCINVVAPALQATSAAGNILNWYENASGGIGNTVNPVPATSVAGVINYYVSQVNLKGCESARVPLAVTINPDAIAEFNPPALVQCPPFTISTKDINLKKYPSNNSEYRWYADGVYIGSGTDFPGYTLSEENEEVVIKLKTVSLFGCKADSISHTFSTPKLPRPAFTLSVSEGCGPLAVTVLNTTPDMDLYSYQWFFANGQTSTELQPGEITFPPNASFEDTIYQVKLVISSICDNIVLTKPLLVKSKPKALFTPTITEGCSPMKVTFKNTSKGLNTIYHWDFGDGNTNDTNIPEDVQHTFYAGTVTNYTVRLTASNECGDDFSEFVMTVAPNKIKLNFAMNGPDHFGCQPHTVNFFNNSSGASAYFWDFGDGNFKSTTLGVETVTHTYLIPGRYEVKLTASNNCNDTTTTDYVTIYPKPTAAFTADQYTSCKGNVVTFTNQSLLGTSYLWSFGDGSTSTLAEPAHLYATQGLYTVRLMVYKLNGPGSTCTDYIEKQIQVVETLPGTFTMSDSKADCAPLTVTFTNENLPAVTAHWDFGDGTNGSGDKVIHTYHFSGTYTITLTTTSPGGCIYVTTKTVEVNGPSGTLQYAGGSACSPSPVRLEAIATNTNSYKWDFGDGTLSTTSNGVVFHEYVKPGTYLPSVALLNNAGCNYFIKGTDSIKIDKVDAGFVSVQERKCGSTNVVFTDTSHVFFGIKSVQWNFGDGIIKEGKRVSHDYTISGKYWVEVIVTGFSGCTQTVRRQVDVQVFTIPEVAIIAEESKCTNQSVLFRSAVQSLDPINIYKWTISNGVTGSGESFNYTFIKPGTYKIDLTVSTINNCSATSSHTIEIKLSPVVKASGDVTICLGNSIQLNASGAAQYQWSPLQSLSCTTCPNPIAIPSISTPYIVEGLNSLGCPGYDTVNVTVIQPLKMTSSGNDSICIGQSANLRVGGAASYKWIPTQTLSNSTIANPVATPGITTGYRVVGYDGHNCFTDTAFIVVAVGKYPTVDLGPDKILSTGTILPLVSTYTEGPIKDWKWTPTLDLDCVACAVPNAHIKKNITYALEVTSIYGCKASDTISIKVFCESAQVFIPNAFSPDGDGINDVLMVRGKGIVSVKSFRIFNRWGQLVFERSNFPPNEPTYGWDGRVGGKPGPPEVYVFTAEVLCENGVPFTYKGNTTIIK